MRLRLRGMTLLALSLVFSARALTQDPASITGTVMDPTGASIPEAQITVQNREHGITLVPGVSGG